MFATVDCLGSNKGDLHGKESTHSVKSCVGHISMRSQLIGQGEVQCKNRDDINDKGIAPPAGNHIEETESSDNGPFDRPLSLYFYGVNCFDVHVERENKGENRHCFIVVGTCHRSLDIGGNECHEKSTVQAGKRVVGHFVGEEISGDSSKGCENWGNEHTDISDIGREGHEFE